MEGLNFLADLAPIRDVLAFTIWAHFQRKERFLTDSKNDGARASKPQWHSPASTTRTRRGAGTRSRPAAVRPETDRQSQDESRRPDAMQLIPGSSSSFELTFLE